MNQSEYIPPGRLIERYINIYYDLFRPIGQRLKGGRLWHLRDSADCAADLFNYLGVLAIEVNIDDLRE
jgi:hypothetical protein